MHYYHCSSYACIDLGKEIHGGGEVGAGMSNVKPMDWMRPPEVISLAHVIIGLSQHYNLDLSVLPL